MMLFPADTSTTSQKKLWWKIQKNPPTQISPLSTLQLLEQDWNKTKRQHIMNHCICHLLMGEDNNTKKALRGDNAVDTWLLQTGIASLEAFTIKLDHLYLSLQTDLRLFELCSLCVSNSLWVLACLGPPPSKPGNSGINSFEIITSLYGDHLPSLEGKYFLSSLLPVEASYISICAPC